MNFYQKKNTHHLHDNLSKSLISWYLQWINKYLKVFFEAKSWTLNSSRLPSIVSVSKMAWQHYLRILNTMVVRTNLKTTILRSCFLNNKLKANLNFSFRALKLFWFMDRWLYLLLILQFLRNKNKVWRATVYYSIVGSKVWSNCFMVLRWNYKNSLSDADLFKSNCPWCKHKIHT